MVIDAVCLLPLFPNVEFETKPPSCVAMLLASWKRSATLSARSVSVAVRTIFRSGSDGSDATFVSVAVFVPLLDDGAICPVLADDDPELLSVVLFPPGAPAPPDVL